MPAFSRAFLAEAKQLASADFNGDSILTVAASQLLCLGCACNGSDRLATYFKWEGVRMGERLALFSVQEPTMTVPAYEHWRPDVLIATSHVAWGVFNWQCHHGRYYGERPARSSPPFPTPSRCRLQYRASSDGSHAGSDYLSSTGKAFGALCRFRQIQNEVLIAYHERDSNPAADHIPLRFAEEKYRELLAWASSLEPEVRRGENCPHHILVLQ